jgi:hypothetical protein
MTETTVTVTGSTGPALPDRFAELAPYSDWIFETWRERYEKRLASTMDEMQAFYDAIMPRVDEIIEYCNGFDIDDLPDEVRHLLQLVFALGEASFPVEAWRQPRVPDSGAADIEMVSEPPL